jgi:hypothetical protein
VLRLVWCPTLLLPVCLLLVRAVPALVWSCARCSCAAARSPASSATAARSCSCATARWPTASRTACTATRAARPPSRTAASRDVSATPSGAELVRLFAVLIFVQYLLAEHRNSPREREAVLDETGGGFSRLVICLFLCFVLLLLEPRDGSRDGAHARQQLLAAHRGQQRTEQEETFVCSYLVVVVRLKRTRSRTSTPPSSCGNHCSLFSFSSRSSLSLLFLFFFLFLLYLFSLHAGRAASTTRLGATRTILSLPATTATAAPAAACSSRTTTYQTQ